MGSYQLRPLLYPSLPSLAEERLVDAHLTSASSVAPTPPASAHATASSGTFAGIQGTSSTVRCAEAFGRNLFVGTSDGKIHRYRLTKQGSSSHTDLYRYVNTLAVGSTRTKPIERLLVLFPSSASSLLAVLCESALTFYHAPSLVPVAASVLPVVKGLATVVLDDAEVLSSDVSSRQRLDRLARRILAEPESTDTGAAEDQQLAEELDPEDQTEGQASSVSLCLIRRKSLVLVQLSSIPLPSPEPNGDQQQQPSRNFFLEWQVIKEVPLPGGATMARRHGSKLVFSNTTEYRLLDLKSDQIFPLGLPISQTQDSPSASVRPSIVTLSLSAPPSGRTGGGRPPLGSEARCEFLITSHSQDQTLGVFIRSDTAEPTPKLIEWPSHPRSVVLIELQMDQGGQQAEAGPRRQSSSKSAAAAEQVSVALLRNDTIEVHSLDSMQRLQTIHVPDLFGARFLNSATTKFLVDAALSHAASGEPSDRLRAVRLAVGTVTHPELLQDEANAASRRNHQESRSPFSAAEIIVGGKDGLQVLSETSIVDRAAKLVDAREWDQLQSLSDTLWATSGNAASAARSGARNIFSLEAYLSQVLAFHHLKAMRFEAARNAFWRGQTALPLIVRTFPEVADGLLHGSDAGAWDGTSSVPAGLENEYRSWRPIDGLISSNLHWNYSPHMDIDTDPAALLLREALHGRARAFLRGLLEDARNAGQETYGCDARVVDTALARLYAMDDMPHELGQLLGESSNACDASLLQAVLQDHARHGALAEMARRRGDLAEYLSIATKLVDGELVDQSWTGGLPDIISAIETSSHQDLVTRFGIWVTTHDPDAGIRILTRKGTVKATARHDQTAQVDPAGRGGEPTAPTLEEHRYVLQQLQDAKVPAAAETYLEHVALAKRSTLPELQEQLLETLYARFIELSSDSSPEALNAMEAAEADYVQGFYAESFLAHLALLAPHSPLVVARLKLALLMQSSSALDAESMLTRIRQRGDAHLRLEQAILLGKLGKHPEALHLLALELHDANSAEAYCAQRGIVISSVLAERIHASTEVHSLKPYISFLSRSHRANKSQANKVHQTQKTELLKVLLSVYTSAPQAEEIKLATAHLLNTQAMHMSPVEVLGLIRQDWPISTLETFLSRFFRRQMHELQEGQIVKNISFAQNLEAQEKAWADLRSMGGYIQDVDEDNAAVSGPRGDSQPSEKGDASEEKSTMLSTSPRLDKEADFNRPIHALRGEM